jgi:hypothetical protein
MTRPFRPAIGLLAALWLLPASAQPAPQLGEAEMLGFLVQCIATDKAGQPALPGGPDARCQPQTASDRAEWRKHDWPDRRDPAAQPLGHQASDAVLGRGYQFPVVVQTFDFGDSGRRFGRLERANGDGGDAVTVLDGAAWIFFTEDGGGGQQWFVAEACQTDRRPQAPRESWLLFDQTVARDSWRDRLARLNIARSPGDCPSSFNNAYTRFLRSTVRVPYRAVAANKAVRTGSWDVDTIVSEHFGGRSIQAADHLERFYFGRGLGKYRWERWEALARSKEKNLEERAGSLAESGRCTDLPHSEPPAEGWMMTDCRTWTNLVRQPEPWAAASLGWPGTAFDAIRARE